MPNKLMYTTGDFYVDANKICRSEVLNRYIKGKKYTKIHPVPRGGFALASFIAGHFCLPLTNYATEDSLVVDDIIDSGRTRQKYKNFDFVALHSKDHAFYSNDKATLFANTVSGSTWIEYPWEKNESSIQEAVVRTFEIIGEDPTRNGLLETPLRVEKMYKQIFRGYDPEQMPKITDFPNEAGTCDYVNSLIIDKGYFYSCCEHHMVPFFGQYYFGYIPDCKIIGASKIARVIDYYAAKLQIQERLAIDVVNCFEEAVKPNGIILVLRARHLCKEMRGVAKHNSPFETIEARGWLLENRNGCKDEFIARCSIPDMV